VERAPEERTTPLDPDEEAAWRAIARAVLVVPRTLDSDLLAGCGLSLAEYIVLVNLSEAPGNSMRMNELAVESTLSPSGVTRLIERMERMGLVEREQAAQDARGMTATLTGAGLERLRESYPHALASVRTNVMDHLDGLDLAAFAEAVGKFATAEPGRYPRRSSRRQPAHRGAKPAQASTSALAAEPPGSSD
jgi:DNA-binding MarR family transcriptional regulator